MVKVTGTRPKIVVSADGRDVVGDAGARLLADVAEATGLTHALGDALSGFQQRPGTDDPAGSRLVWRYCSLTVGKQISDLAALHDQETRAGAV